MRKLQSFTSGTGAARYRALLVMIVLALLLVACETETDDENTTAEGPTQTVAATATTSEPDATTAPTNTPQPEATQEPTSPPEPTSTPEPTNTPEPTATPVPPTPTPDTSIEEAEYIDMIIGQSETLGESLGTFGELSENPQFFDQNWIISVAWEFHVWRTEYETAQEFNPPARFQSFHSKWLEVLSKLDSASYDLSSGIDNLDVDSINAGTAKIIEANSLMDEAFVLLEEARS